MNFRETAADLERLEQELIEIRSDLSENAAKTAKAKCTTWGSKIESRTRRRKRITSSRRRAYSGRRNCSYHESVIDHLPMRYQYEL